MNLFIDGISNPCFLALFDNNRQIVDSFSFEAKGNESSLLIPNIDKLLKQNNLEYKTLKNIVVVNGPGSFTGVRTIVLTANSINYIINKNMTAISYFDMFSNYPIFKASSKRDCFVKYSKDYPIEIVTNEKLEKQNISLEKIEKIDYSSIIQKLKLDKLKQIEALYIKKPNIS